MCVCGKDPECAVNLPSLGLQDLLEIFGKEGKIAGKLRSEGGGKISRHDLANLAVVLPGGGEGGGGGGGRGGDRNLEILHCLDRLDTCTTCTTCANELLGPIAPVLFVT